MIEAKAVVIRADEGKAWARLVGHSGGCGHCDEPGGCHAPRFAEMFKSSDKVFSVDDPLGLHVGEQVKVLIDDGLPLRAAMASYGLGTALVLAGALLGVCLAPPAWADAASAAGAVTGLLSMVFVLRYRARRRGAAVWRLRLERSSEQSPSLRVEPVEVHDSTENTLRLAQGGRNCSALYQKLTPVRNLPLQGDNRARDGRKPAAVLSPGYGRELKRERDGGEAAGRPGQGV
ncbi:MAG: SoxR reducing system RseC family protein [Azoarcus sp.]|jgi:sigma-E factor negative regulatory protein RseC|nr:SoxR reducing system RseC family protein [Azoarcus sp.]